MKKSLILILFLAGCAGSPLAISMKTPEQLKSVPDYQLCDAYASVKSEKIKTELLSRNLFTDKEWQAIEKHSIFVGMSKLALFATRPNLYLNGISEIGNYGMCEIYSEFATTVGVYIYVRGDKVVGYQLY
jgi:hypothetical protein